VLPSRLILFDLTFSLVPGPLLLLASVAFKVSALVSLGTTLINRTTCAFLGPCVVSFRYCLGSEVRAIAHLGPTTLICSGQFKDRLSNVYGRIPWTWNDYGGPLIVIDFASLGAWEGASTKGQCVSIQRLSSTTTQRSEPGNKVKKKETFSS
jgi:hypothetical protein